MLLFKSTTLININDIGALIGGINKTKEDISTLEQLSAESNCDQTENIKAIRMKMDKIDVLYEKHETKTRNDVLQYIRQIDIYAIEACAGAVTNTELAVVTKILRTVHSYEQIFGSEFPDDVQKNIDALKAINGPNLRKRAREQDDMHISSTKRRT